MVFDEFFAPRSFFECIELEHDDGIEQKRFAQRIAYVGFDIGFGQRLEFGDEIDGNRRLFGIALGKCTRRRHSPGMRGSGDDNSCAWFFDHHLEFGQKAIGQDEGDGARWMIDIPHVWREIRL